MSTTIRALAAALETTTDPAERDELAQSIAWHESADIEEER